MPKKSIYLQPSGSDASYVRAPCPRIPNNRYYFSIKIMMLLTEWL